MHQLPNSTETSVPRVEAGAELESWLAFLHSVWGSDVQSIETLQEFFGLFLAQETGFQKILMVVGPPISGKGVLAGVLRALLQADKVSHLALEDLASPFGLASLIGKDVVIVPDARFKAGHNQAEIVRNLLSITGEDVQTIYRKHQEAWIGRLGARFCLLSNAIPALDDIGRAFYSRLVLLQMTKSFRDEQDYGLSARLMLELPAIRNWAVAGAQRLLARGRFIQPDSAKDSLLALTQDGCATSGMTSE